MSLKKRSVFSRLFRVCKAALHVNQFEKMLRREKNPTTINIVWNRGMGDIPLGLYGVNMRIRHFFPQANIVYLTRGDLLDVFAMLPDCCAREIPGLKRGEKCDLSNIEREGVVLENLDPTRDLPWLPGTVIPRLTLGKIVLSFPLQGKRYVGMHIDTETGGYYGYEKNWSKKNWERLIEMVVASGRTPILFGQRKSGVFDGVFDLRGETTVREVCAILFKHCTALIAPDSGILSTIYYIDSTDPLQVISLWNDPKQGILRQNVPSPNRNLVHTPLIGLATISPDDVYSHLNFEQGKVLCE